MSNQTEPPSPVAPQDVPPAPSLGHGPAAIQKLSEQKWTAEVLKAGFCLVPSLLLRAQDRLGINPTQLAILVQLCDYWWDPAKKPYPGKEQLATRLRLSPRQVQRQIAELEGAGFLKREIRVASNGGLLSNTYDLSGLVQKLKAIAPQFQQAAQGAKRLRNEVERSGYKQRHLQPEP